MARRPRSWCENQRVTKPRSRVGGWIPSREVGHAADGIAEYVIKYASKDAADEAGAESDDEDDMSSVGSFGDEDDEPAGQMEEV